MLVQNRYFALMDLFTLVRSLCTESGAAAEAKDHNDGDELIRIAPGETRHNVIKNCIGGKEFLQFIVRG
jgi:hypothetical protein